MTIYPFASANSYQLPSQTTQAKQTPNTVYSELGDLEESAIAGLMKLKQFSPSLPALTSITDESWESFKARLEKLNSQGLERVMERLGSTVGGLKEAIASFYPYIPTGLELRDRIGSFSIKERKRFERLVDYYFPNGFRKMKYKPRRSKKIDTVAVPAKEESKAAPIPTELI